MLCLLESLISLTLSYQEYILESLRNRSLMNDLSQKLHLAKLPFTTDGSGFIAFSSRSFTQPDIPLLKLRQMFNMLSLVGLPISTHIYSYLEHTHRQWQHKGVVFYLV